MIPESSPDWASSISVVGRIMAAQPATPVGEPAPRLLLSVPTGQYVAWLLANGALKAPPKLGRDPIVGDKVVAWLSGRLLDVEVKAYSDNQWEINNTVGMKRGAIGKKRVPGVVLPDEVPNGRGVGRPTQEYRSKLQAIPGMQQNYSNFYADQCVSPVVVIGDGKEFLQNQRDELVDTAHKWLEDRSAILLDQDTGQVSNPDRMLFHPFMILSPGVAKANPWLRSLTPRLVIVTRWSYYRRMDPALFAGSPMVILANRRVGDNWYAIDATAEYQNLSTEFRSLKLNKFPNGIFARKFSTRVEVPTDGDEEEWEI